jgi:hypothetical protein
MKRIITELKVIIGHTYGISMRDDMYRAIDDLVKTDVAFKTSDEKLYNLITEKINIIANAESFTF